MPKLPRWYYRIENFNSVYRELVSFLEIQKHNSKPDKQILLNTIKSLYVLYYKILRDLLKEKGIKLFFPREIFITAEENGIIKNSQIWLEFIDLLNILCYEKDLKLQEEIVDKILDQYIPVLKNVHKELTIMNKSITKFKPPTFSMDSMSYTTPKYNAQELGITPEAYKIFMNFVCTHTDIKHLWLYGSRLENTNRPNSDIDMLVDCPLEKFEQLKSALKKVRIPYHIDFVNIHDTQNRNFVAVVSTNAKLIYNSNDLPLPIK